MNLASWASCFSKPSTQIVQILWDDIIESSKPTGSNAGEVIPGSEPLKQKQFFHNSSAITEFENDQIISRA